VHVVIPSTTSTPSHSHYDYAYSDDNTLSQCPTQVDLEGPGPPPPLLSLEAEQYITRGREIKGSASRPPPRTVWRQVSKWIRRALVPLTQAEVDSRRR
jgi:hypothetical protein